MPWWWHYIYCVLWIVLGLHSSKWKLHLKDTSYLGKCRMEIGKIFAGQYAIFWLFTPLGYLVHYSDTSLHMITRSISTTLQVMLMIGAFMATSYFFKEKLLKYTFISMAINYTVIIILALVLCGAKDFVTYGLFPFTDAANAYSATLKSSRILEVHDVTFAAGFFFLYAVIWRKRLRDKNSLLLGSAVLMYLGWKRSEILVCFLLIIAAQFIRTKSKNSIRFWNYIYTAAVVGASFIWIWIIGSGFYNVLIEQYGITFNSREKMYAYMSQLFLFSPFYFGRGMSAGIITNEDLISSGISIIHGHSDTMLAYIDYGFWGMLTWLLYCTWFVTRKLMQKYSTDAAKLWLLFTAYAFVTYLTDNTSTYFAFQTVYMVIMFHVLYAKPGTPVYERPEIHTFGIEMVET